jgi:manganese/zinc/iron transport system permease protein
MSSGVVIILTGVLVASACAVLGCFLVLRKMAMLTDAISHAILPGIVVAYFFAHGPNILAGFIGAAVAGLITVVLIETLQNTRRVGNESAIGIIFPAMFALGTFLVSKFFANVHLDTDAILYGNIEFSSLDLLFINGVNLGPQSLWIMGALCIINFSFVAVFYKELKLATFDAGLAATLGFSPIVIHYALMSIVSITTVGAFTAVGAILVVALMIVPAATAYLLTDRLPRMIVLSVLVGSLSAFFGYWVAMLLDASIAGAIVSVAGVFFGLALLFSPAHGLVARWRRVGQQRDRFASEMLVVHLFNHEGSPQFATENNIHHLREELRWSNEFTQRVVRHANHEGLIKQRQDALELTDIGRQRAQLVIAR